METAGREPERRPSPPLPLSLSSSLLLSLVHLSASSRRYARTLLPRLACFKRFRQSASADKQAPTSCTAPFANSSALSFPLTLLLVSKCPLVVSKCLLGSLDTGIITTTLMVKQTQSAVPVANWSISMSFVGCRSWALVVAQMILFQAISS